MALASARTVTMTKVPPDLEGAIEAMRGCALCQIGPSLHCRRCHRHLGVHDGQYGVCYSCEKREAMLDHVPAVLTRLASEVIDLLEPHMEDARAKVAQDITVFVVPTSLREHDGFWDLMLDTLGEKLDVERLLEGWREVLSRVREGRPSLEDELAQARAKIQRMEALVESEAKSYEVKVEREEDAPPIVAPRGEDEEETPAMPVKRRGRPPKDRSSIPASISVLGSPSARIRTSDPVPIRLDEDGDPVEDEFSPCADCGSTMLTALMIECFTCERKYCHRCAKKRHGGPHSARIAGGG